MQLVAPSSDQTRIGGIPDQGVLEGVAGAWRLSAAEDQSCVDQLVEGIAQLVVVPVVQVSLEVVESFEASVRGAGGFGSSGRV